MSVNEPRILVIDDDADILSAARVAILTVMPATVDILQNLEQLDGILRTKTYDLILLDMNFSTGYVSGNEGLSVLDRILVQVPNQGVIMMTAYGSIRLAVESMKRGALDFIVKPWINQKLKSTIATALRKIKPLRNTSELQPEIIKCKSPAMTRLMEMTDKVAGTDASVLIRGESGTGKDYLANYIHLRSRRKIANLVKIDLGAIHANLLESELFGYKKGAFTDAKEDTQGKVELAQGGTLFLDEVENLPLMLQPKLLSFLQNRSFIPVGSNRPVQLDFRLISSSSTDLTTQVYEDHFREDLLFRINTIELVIPPLRERREDVPDLVDFFFRSFMNKHERNNLVIQDVAMRALCEYDFPGNLRELQHMLERAVILSEGPVIQVDDLFSRPTRDESQEVLHREEVERQIIMKALKKHQGNMRQAAKELGYARSTLYRKVQRYGL